MKTLWNTSLKFRLISTFMLLFLIAIIIAQIFFFFGLPLPFLTFKGEIARIIEHQNDQLFMLAELQQYYYNHWTQILNEWIILMTTIGLSEKTDPDIETFIIDIHGNIIKPDVFFNRTVQELNTSKFKKLHKAYDYMIHKDSLIGITPVPTKLEHSITISVLDSQNYDKLYVVNYLPDETYFTHVFNSILKMFFIVSLIAVFITMMFIMHVNIILTPLYTLKKAVNEAKKKGHFSVKLKYPYDEVGMLAHSFYNLMKRIHNWKEEVDLKVEQKTWELKHANIFLQEEIDAKEKIQEQLQKAQHRLEIKNKISQFVISESVEGCFHKILLELKASFKSTFGLIVTFDNDDLFDIEFDSNEQDHHFPIPTTNTYNKKAILSNLNLQEEKDISPFYTNTRNTSIFGSLDLKNSLFVPLKLHDTFYGFIQLGNKKDEYTEDNLDILTAVGEQLAPLIEVWLSEAHEQRLLAASNQALIISEEKFRQFFEDSKDMIFFTNIDNEIVDINNAGIFMLGYKNKEELKKKKFKDICYNPADITFLRHRLAEKGYVKDLELILRKKDGSSLFCELTGSAVFDLNKQIKKFQGSIRDISDRIEYDRKIWEANIELVQINTKLKESQFQIVQQEKLASIGQLAAGVAHEINNPLGFVKSNQSTLVKYINSIFDFLTILKKALKDEPPLLELFEKQYEHLDIDYIISDTKELLAESDEGFSRMISIVKSLKDFSRIDFSGEHLDKLNINEAIRNTLTVAKNEYKYVADIVTDFGEIDPVECYSDQVNQVFLNLIVNASQAIKEQQLKTMGIIEIKTWQDKEYVYSSFADNGGGIPDSVTSKIFDPFFTTKEVGKGTGLGLSISRDIIVNKHSGNLTVTTEAGKGSIFTIKLPKDFAQSLEGLQVE